MSGKLGGGPGGSGHPLAAQPGEDELTVQPGNGTGDWLAAADDGADGGTGADDVHVPGIAFNKVQHQFLDGGGFRNAGSIPR